MTTSTDADDEDPSGRLRDFVESGGQVVGQIAGAALSVVVGPVLGAGAGAALGDVFSKVGLEVHDRLLARRQGARAAGAYDVAAVRIAERLGAGDAPRNDAFFDAGADGRVEAEEVLEGTLLTAANSFEERKVPFIGRMFANVAFDPSISPAHANYLLRLADRVTYRQLVILAFLAAAQDGEYERALVSLVGDGSGRSPRNDVIEEMDDLAEARLVGWRQNDGSVAGPGGTYGGQTVLFRPSNLAQAALRPLGESLHALMELERISRADLDGLLAALRGD